ARVGLFDKPDDLLGAESALLHVRPLGFTDFIASAGTAQWGQVNWVRFEHEKYSVHYEFVDSKLEKITVQARHA
ncbi:hypothetical protein IPR40_02150, partial [Xanthomonas perforans]|nr:hypothetical protein [Xanthomonas perforans]